MAPATFRKQRRHRWPAPGWRLLLLCVSLAITSVCAVAFLVIDVDTPQLSGYFLHSKHLPPGQGLKAKTRRWSKTCDNFGVPNDVYFAKYDGVACGQLTWESAHEFEEGDRFISRANAVYKVFSDETSASEYFWRFWGRHMYELLPPYLYADLSEKVEPAGVEYRAFLWHPRKVPRGLPVPLQATRVPTHSIYLFRQGSIFVRLTVQGFRNGQHPHLQGDAVATLAKMAAEQIKRNKLSPERQKLLNVQTFIRCHLRNGFQSIQSVTRFFSPSLINTSLRFITKFKERMVASACTFLQNVRGPSLKDISLAVVAMVLLLLQPLQCFVAQQPGSQMFSHRLFCHSCLVARCRAASRHK